VGALAKQNAFLEKFVVSRRVVEVVKPSDEKEEE
jgi:hypothetical protein